MWVVDGVRRVPLKAATNTLWKSETKYLCYKHYKQLQKVDIKPDDITI